MALMWYLSLGMLGVQMLIAVLALVALYLPLTVRFARRVHRRRAAVLFLALVAALFPLFYFITHVGGGPKLYYLKYLVASLALPVVQVVLWYLEDKRRIPQNMETRLRM